MAATDKAARPAVLVCEDLAHETRGHYGVRFADLAQGFLDVGCDVYGLTSLSWAYTGDHPFPAERVRRYGWAPGLLFRLTGRRFDVTPWKAVLRNLALAMAARQTLRRLGLKRALIVVVSSDAEPAILSFVGGRHDWIIHRFWEAPRAAPGRLLRWARRAEDRRARAGARMVVALPNPDWIAMWARKRPGLVCRSLRLAGAAKAISSPGSRDVLGLPSTRRIALVFGVGHEDKRSMTAVEAIRLRPDWTLAVVGSGAGALAAMLPEAERPSNLLLRPGAVSNNERRLWHEAADVAILSFAANYRRNSGTLMDALSASCPVLVSDDSFAADLARQYSLGQVFGPEDSSALADCLSRVTPLSAATVEAAMADLGNERLARDHLEAVADCR